MINTCTKDVTCARSRSTIHLNTINFLSTCKLFQFLNDFYNLNISDMLKTYTKASIGNTREFQNIIICLKVPFLLFLEIDSENKLEFTSVTAVL